MYLAIDIGGTKTLLAVFTEAGEIRQKFKFPTPKVYDDFVVELGAAIRGLGDIDFKAACVASPGLIDREEGIGVAFGNLRWENVPIGPDIEKMINAPVIVENDAKLAGLSEALLVKDRFNRVMYITISTGIGVGVVKDGRIDPDFLLNEGGKMLLEHNGRLMPWEDFASGRAIKNKYHMFASEINDTTIWKAVARNISVGLFAHLSIIQPEAVIVGGSIGTHLPKYEKYLNEHLHKYEIPLVPIPPILMAQRPEEAVIYGAYELARDRFSHGA